MKTIIAFVIFVFILAVAPWGTKEANDDCLLHSIQVMVWGWFGFHPDQFYGWRDGEKIIIEK